MLVDIATIRAAARELGFLEATLEKVIRLGQVLEQVNRHPLLKEVLVLKGGTALNLSQSAPQRLSVDLDFNYIGAEDREQMLQQRPAVELALAQVVTSMGYRVQHSRDEHAGRKMYLGYTNAAGRSDRIEVDLNYQFRVPLVPVAISTIWQPTGFRSVSARTVGTQELAAGKISALLDRSAARDIWDVRRLPKFVGADWSSRNLRVVFLAISGALDHAVYTYGRDRLERVSQVDIDTQLFPVLTAADRPSRDRIIRECWTVVAPLLDLADAEKEFVDALQAGHLDPRLLRIRDTDLTDRIGRHPALLWKVQNARENRAAKRKH
jgi:hypothetical protein